MGLLNVDGKATQVARITPILLMLVSLTFVAMGILVVTVGGQGGDWKAWMGIVFFGACAFVGGWWFLSELTDPSAKRPTCKKVAIAEYRNEFENRLSGHWYSRLGGGEEMTHGIAIGFDEDGTGKITQWDNVFGVGDTEESQTEETFRWEPVAKRSIRFVTNSGEASIVTYDFKARKDEYGTLMVLLYEPGHWGKRHFNEEGFWVSPYPLTYCEPRTGEPLNPADGQTAADSKR